VRGHPRNGCGGYVGGPRPTRHVFAGPVMHEVLLHAREAGYDPRTVVSSPDRLNGYNQDTIVHFFGRDAATSLREMRRWRNMLAVLQARGVTVDYL